MSFVRRVKSFSLRKPKTPDEAKSNDSETRLRIRKKNNLHREKSFSMESVPLRVDLERNDLFLRQRNKRKEEETRASSVNLNQAVPKRRVKILTKRDSFSLDEDRFSQCIASHSPPPKNLMPSWVQLRESDKFRKQNRHRYNTLDVTTDLITNFGDESGGAGECCNKPGSFPVFKEDEEQDEEVEIRPARAPKPERPQTLFTTPPTNRKEEPYFEFMGRFKLEIGNLECIEIKVNEAIRVMNDQLLIVDQNKQVKREFRSTLKKGTKLTDKTEVEMVDTNKTTYRFRFESQRDAKLFVEREKSRLAAASKDKSAGSFSIANFLKLWKKRSSRDLLESKGIIRNEPIFGNTLGELCDSSNAVPEVVTRIVELIEEPDNITSMGLYRASANLATVQHIRCEINCGRWDVLEKHRKEVDVLAGTLKLFFRELKEPLIPYDVFQKLLATIRGSSSTDTIGSVIDSIPEPNRSTLLYIIRHLLKVCRYKSENKMDVHNMAICWGPSLILFPDNCVDLVAQTAEYTSITEHLLDYYNTDHHNDEKVEEPPPKPDFTFQVVQKFTEMVESNIGVEGIYRKSGSSTKIDKIVKLIDRKQLDDLGGSKVDVHDLCCALKKFLGALKEPLVPNEIFNYYCEICDKLDEQALREEIRNKINSLPQKDTLLLLLRHLRTVIDHEKQNRMSLNVMTDIWMTTLASPVVIQYKKKIQKFSKLFEILVSLNEQVLPDLLPESETLSRVRESHYDNVLDDISDKNDSFIDNAITKL